MVLISKVPEVELVDELVDELVVELLVELVVELVVCELIKQPVEVSL